MKLKFTAKCSDCFFGSIFKKNGNLVKEIDGYVPQGLGISDDEDYISMTIDLETGQIEDWEPVDVKEFLENLNEDDGFDEDEDEGEED